MKLKDCEVLKFEELTDPEKDNLNPLETCMMPDELFYMLRGAIIMEKEPGDDMFSNFRTSNTYIFTGDPGCGNTEIVEAFAVSALYANYDVIRVSVIQLMGEEQNSTISSINELMDDIEAYANESSIFLLVEDIWLLNDDTRAARLFFSKLRKLKTNIIRNGGKPIIIAALYDGRAEEMPEIFRIDAHIVPVGEQNRRTRLFCFNNALGDLLEKQETITADMLADMTESFSLGELTMAAENITMYIRGLNLSGDDPEELKYADNISDTANVNISKETVEMLIAQVRNSRVRENAPHIRRSVYNYPSAKQVGGAISIASPMMVGAAEENEKKKMENSRNLISEAKKVMDANDSNMDKTIVPSAEKSFNRKPLRSI